MMSEKDFVKSFFDKFVSVGICIEKVETLLKDEVFYNLSKHNPYWDSEEEKMQDLRMKLCFIEGTLIAIRNILQPTDE